MMNRLVSTPAGVRADARWLTLLMVMFLAACGGGSDGARVIAAPQTLAFDAAPALTLGVDGRDRTTVHASASSGLAVRYASGTPAVCSVEAATGLVVGLAPGDCTVTADQAGNEQWAVAPQAVLTLAVKPDPRQTIRFAAAPVLTLGGTATVSASASSGLPVRYSGLTPAICTVTADGGVVTGLALGDCTVAADQPGDANHDAAAQVTQTLAVTLPAGVGVPGAPMGVAATLGGDARTVVVNATRVDSGGRALTGYTIRSVPAGITVAVAALPARIDCARACAGHAFSVSASNDLGPGPASAAADVITTLRVVATFREPDTQPRDSVFSGSFTLNSTTGVVSGLTGSLTESMTGAAAGAPPLYDMTQVPLQHQLQQWRDDALGGRFVASFARNTTATFSTAAGGDGWSPAAGVAVGGVYAGFPAPYVGTVQNSYVLIFVPDDPFAALSAAQIARLAYADCAPGGMMGAVCMTGTSVAGHGAVGTMSGYPAAQVISQP